jgi:hypothetical protein
LLYTSWDRLTANQTIVYGTSAAGLLFTIDSFTGKIGQITSDISISTFTHPVSGNKLKPELPTVTNELQSLYITKSGKLTRINKDGTTLWVSKKGNLHLEQQIVPCDIENDGIKEVIVISADKEAAFVIDGATGKTMLTLRPGHKITAPPALGASGESKHPKIVLALSDNSLCVFSSTSGELINKISTESFTKGILIQPCLYDVNRDKESEAIIATENGELIILSLKHSKIIAREKLSFSSTGTISLADINGDKRIDIITQLTNGRIEALTINCPCSQGQLVYGQPACK